MSTTTISNNLYESVVTITYDYLGPAADRFVTRQIRNHLKKDPQQLEPKDLRQLMDWIRLAMQLISSDSEVIDQYLADLEALTRSSRKSLSTDGKKAR